MSTTHHPLDETLLEYFSGTLDEGRRIVVAAHLEMCASCRRVLSGLATAGGDYLDALPPAPLAEGALETVLTRLQSPATENADTANTVRPASTHDLPIRLRALERYELGKWRWIGPGVYWRSVAVPDAAKARVFLLKAAPGTKLPEHAHEGTELTVILKGAFRHQGGVYKAGDCDDADETVEHSPVVEPGEECICLVAMQGNIRLRSFIGRLIQPLVRL